uniref:FGFR1 oncogene partner n=1 Tax=Oryzias sinensis TaxID=183150 RepID=A0A8C7XU13_9TELE
MSAAEDDTELRDLVIQNLENSGVLNKMKAEMRAAVFLAMEDQDRLENKVPLVNESLKKCLNSRDGDTQSDGEAVGYFSIICSLPVFLPETSICWYSCVASPGRFFSSQDGVPVLPADNEDLQQLTTSPNQKQEHLDLDLNAVVNLEEEDSFFDDPLPKPQKTYGQEEEEGLAAERVGGVCIIVACAAGLFVKCGLPCRSLRLQGRELQGPQ